MPIMVNLTCENNMLTDISTYNSVLVHAQIGRIFIFGLYCTLHQKQLSNYLFNYLWRNVYLLS